MGGYGALLILAGAAGLYIWNLGKAAGNLIFRPGNITGFALDGLSPSLSTELIVQNTSNISFTINSIAGNVTSNGTQVGNISSFIPVSIPANSQVALPVILALQPIGLVNEIITVLSGGAGTRNLRIDGSVNANGLQQSFSVEFKIGG